MPSISGGSAVSGAFAINVWGFGRGGASPKRPHPPTPRNGPVGTTVGTKEGTILGGGGLADSVGGGAVAILAQAYLCTVLCTVRCIVL